MGGGCDRGGCGGEAVCVIDDAIWRLFAPGFHCSPVAQSHFLDGNQEQIIFTQIEPFQLGPICKSGARGTVDGLVIVCFSVKRMKFSISLLNIH